MVSSSSRNSIVIGVCACTAIIAAAAVGLTIQRHKDNQTKQTTDKAPKQQKNDKQPNSSSNNDATNAGTINGLEEGSSCSKVRFQDSMKEVASLNKQVDHNGVVQSTHNSKSTPGPLENLSKPNTSHASSFPPQSTLILPLPEGKPLSTAAVVECSCARASGKVLLSGGYLVLDQEQSGIVFNVSADIRTHIALLNQHTAAQIIRANESHNDNDNELTIYVYTPQIVKHLLHLVYDKSTKLLKTSKRDSAFRNCFLETTLQLTLQFIEVTVDESVVRDQTAGALLIYVEGDDEFYSGESGKTGLGSSAAFVSSLVAALFNHFKVLNEAQSEEMNDRNNVNECEEQKVQLHLPSVSSPLCLSSATVLSIAHNLSQVCHCASQGKVGSGFDISAAFYGSQRYKRFSKKIIENVLVNIGKKSVEDEVLVKTVLPSLADLSGIASLVNSNQSTPRHTNKRQSFNATATLTPRQHKDNLCKFLIPTDVQSFLSSRPSVWDHHIEAISLPQQFTVLLGAVNNSKGSSTSEMVKKLQQWRDNDVNAAAPWSQLCDANQRFESLLLRLTASCPDSALFTTTVQAMSTLSCEQWCWLAGEQALQLNLDANLVTLLSDLRSTHSLLRSLYKKIGQLAGVEIEPVQQSELCDATLQLSGVLLCGCPGAGGYDAVFAVVMTAEAVLAVEKMWSESGVKRLKVSVVQRQLQVKEEQRDISSLPIFK